MMRNYCLNVAETDQIIKWRACGKDNIGEELLCEIKASQCWDSKLVCISLFVARIIERNNTTISEKEEIIEILYKMCDELFFEIQEGDKFFIEYLLKHIRSPDASLEDTLIEIQHRLSEYDYEKTLRY